MAYVERSGGSSAAIVAIFAIALIVLLLLIVRFFVHPFHIFSPTSSPVSVSSLGGQW